MRSKRCVCVRAWRGAAGSGSVRLGRPRRVPAGRGTHSKSSGGAAWACGRLRCHAPRHEGHHAPLPTQDVSRPRPTPAAESFAPGTQSPAPCAGRPAPLTAPAACAAPPARAPAPRPAGAAPPPRARAPPAAANCFPPGGGREGLFRRGFSYAYSSRRGFPRPSLRFRRAQELPLFPSLFKDITRARRRPGQGAKTRRGAGGHSLPVLCQYCQAVLAQHWPLYWHLASRKPSQGPEQGRAPPPLPHAPARAPPPPCGSR